MSPVVSPEAVNDVTLAILWLVSLVALVGLMFALRALFRERAAVTPRHRRRHVEQLHKKKPR